MARIVITNQSDKYQKAKQRNINAGFRDFNEGTANNIYHATFKKRIIKTENFLKFQNGDFVSAVGTIIYKSLFGKPALKKIYEDFNGQIENIRNNAFGNYIIAIKKDNYIYVFLDKYQTIKTYYYNLNGKWFLTNSLADVGAVIDEIVIDEFAFMQEAIQIGVIGKQSMFKDVFQLYGYEYLEMDINSNVINIKNLPYSRFTRDFGTVSIEQIVEEFADKALKYYKEVASIFGDNLAIHMTGGLDNRTTFAGFMAAGCKPRLLYGVGNSRITNTHKEDLEVVKRYAKAFGLDLHHMNWRHNKLQRNEHWKKHFNRYGFSYSIYGACENYFKEYEREIPNYPVFFETGYMGETLRLREWAQNTGKTFFSLNDFITKYHIKECMTSDFYTNRNLFLNNLYNLFYRHINIFDIQLFKQDFFHIDDFEGVRFLSNMYADLITMNHLNDFSHSISILSAPELYEFAINIPAKYRVNGKFQLMLIDKLFPEALNIPIFSHQRFYKLDKNHLTITKETTVKEQFSQMAKSIKVKGNPSRLLRKAYQFFLESKNEKQNKNESELLKDFLINIIDKDSKVVDNFIKPESFNGNIIILMRFAQYLHGIRLLMEEKNA